MSDDRRRSRGDLGGFSVRASPLLLLLVFSFSFFVLLVAANAALQVA